jgi:hypothetical protein
MVVVVPRYPICVVGILVVIALVVSVESSVVVPVAVVAVSVGKVVEVDFEFVFPFSVVDVVESHGSSNHAFVSNDSF